MRSREFDVNMFSIGNETKEKMKNKNRKNSCCNCNVWMYVITL